MVDDDGMDSIADDTVRKTDEALQDDEFRLLQQTSSDLAKLKVRLPDCPQFDDIVRIVQESAARNEDIADLKGRLKDLGDTAQGTVKQLVALAKDLPRP